MEAKSQTATDIAHAPLRSNRWLWLDGLRGLAAFMVFAHHAQPPGWADITVGWDSGVLIFFALSGFLLYERFAAARRDGRSVDLADYAIRRTFRIMPAYLVAAVAIAAAGGWWWYIEDPLALVLATSTPVIVVWTLTLELQFYVLLPMLDRGLAAVSRGRFDRMLAAIFGLAVGSVVYNAAVVSVGIAQGRPVSTGDIATVASYLWAFAPGLALHTWSCIVPTWLDRSPRRWR